MNQFADTNPALHHSFRVKVCAAWNLAAVERSDADKQEAKAAK